MTFGRKVSFAGFTLCALGVLVTEFFDSPSAFDYFFKTGFAILIVGIFIDALKNWSRK